MSGLHLVLEGSFMGSQSCFEGGTCQTCVAFEFFVFLGDCCFVDNFFDKHFLSKGHSLFLGQLHVFTSGAGGSARSLAFLADITEPIFGVHL